MTSPSGAAVLLGLLLIAPHGLSPQPGETPAGAPDHDSTVFGVLTGAFILVLAGGAAVLIAHMESLNLFQRSQVTLAIPVDLVDRAAGDLGRC